MPVKRVAVIGAGPAGAITVDALAQEQAFDVIRVFERRKAPGGCWIDEDGEPQPLSDFDSLAARTADPPRAVPDELPAHVPAAGAARHSESSIYPYLETNVHGLTMEFTQEPFPTEQSAWSVAMHGEDTPFRPWRAVRGYVRSLFDRKGYADLVCYNTTVEQVEKIGDQWKITLRRLEGDSDYWWAEWFDAVVVAAGHFWVPWIPKIEGLEELERDRPRSVLHSKHYRGRDGYKGKRVVVVGASVSAADIAVDITQTAAEVHSINVGRNYNRYFGSVAFEHPKIHNHPTISHITGRTAHLVDGTRIDGVDHIIFGTGYSSSQPFLPQVTVRNNRVIELYQHVVWQRDPTLLFVGKVGAGLTFKIYEWQAVYAARLLAGRGTLPPLEEQKAWEAARIAAKGDSTGFMAVVPDFEEYFETVRKLAGDGAPGVGRKLPPFRPEWTDAFEEGHQRRKAMWARLNAAARAEVNAEVNGTPGKEAGAEPEASAAGSEGKQTL